MISGHPKCQSPCPPSDFMGLKVKRDLSGNNDHICDLSFAFYFSAKNDILRGGRRSLESLFKNSLFWYNLKLQQEFIYFHHFSL